MFLKFSFFIALIMPPMLAKSISDGSEVLLSIVDDIEAKPKRQAEFFDSIQAAIEKYEKWADDNLSPSKVLSNNNNNNYKLDDTFIYPNVQQPNLRNTNYPNPNSKQFNSYSQPQQNTGYAQTFKPDPVLSASRQYLPYRDLNYRILPPIYMSNGFKSIPRTYNPQYMEELLTASAIFLGDKLVSVDSPSCKCSKEIVKRPFNNKIEDFAQPSSGLESSFEIQKATPNDLLSRLDVIARSGNEKNVQEIQKNIQTPRSGTTARDCSKGIISSRLTGTEKTTSSSLTNRGQIQSRKSLNPKNMSSSDINNTQTLNSTLIISTRSEKKEILDILANTAELRAVSVDFTSTTSNELDAYNSRTEITSTTTVAITENPISSSSTDDEPITSTKSISTDTSTPNSDKVNSSSTQISTESSTQSNTESSTVTQDSTQDPTPRTTETPSLSTTLLTTETQSYYTKKPDNNIITNKYIMKNIESSKNSPNYSSLSLRNNRLRTNNAQLYTKNSLQKSLPTISLANNGKFKSVNEGWKSTKSDNKYVETQEGEEMQMDNRSPNNPYTDCMCGTDSNQISVLQRPQYKDPYAAPISSETYSIKYPELKMTSPVSSIYWHKIEEKTLNQPKEVEKQTWQSIQSNKYDDYDSQELEIFSEEDDYGNLYESGEKYYFT